MRWRITESGCSICGGQPRLGDQSEPVTQSALDSKEQGGKEPLWLQHMVRCGVIGDGIEDISWDQVL